MNQDTTVLDPAQIKRIEATHRGFLYQHLYAVACLLKATTDGAEAIVVEQDEDIEIKAATARVYVQVKTRAESLQPNDIWSTLERFGQLRGEHSNRKRAGDCHFLIIANVDPSPALAGKLESREWPQDVSLVWPNGSVLSVGIAEQPVVLRASADVQSLFAYCLQEAEDVKFSAIGKETLVWKLAAIVQSAAAGEWVHHHELKVSDSASLFEQLTLELHDFPIPPEPYWPQENEPALDGPGRIRLLVGFSGGGKTAWAAQAATHTALKAAYFDARGGRSETIGLNLARELGTRWLDRGSLGAVLAPGNRGADALRIVSRLLEGAKQSTFVVLDNVHEVDDDTLREVVQCCSSTKFVLLAQPWANQSKVEALLGIRAEQLGGWSPDTIGSVCAQGGLAAGPEDCARIRELTAGIPLYVIGLVGHMKRYGGDVGGFLDEWSRGRHLAETPQEALLEDIFERLGELPRTVVSLLAFVTVPLGMSELRPYLVNSLGISAESATAACRDLSRIGALVALGNGTIALHDAFRPLGPKVGTDPAVMATAYRNLRELLIRSIGSHPDNARSRLLVLLLPLTGDSKTLVDLATDDLFYEYGTPDFYGDIETYLQTTGLSPTDRFWALEAQTYADLRSADIESAERHLADMEPLVGALAEDAEAVARFRTKQMLIAAHHHDIAAVDGKYGEIRKMSLSKAARQVADYSYAVSLFQCDMYKKAEELALQLANQYYEVVGLEPEDVFAKNPEEIAKVLGSKVEEDDTLKHLADCLDLYARARTQQHLRSGLARLHALKFYDMAHAIRSIVKVGQDVVDEYLGMLGDAPLARRFIEGTLLPLVVNYRLAEYIVPVRAQYAVVLAYCGEQALARRELAKLQGYVPGLRDDQQAELAGQSRLIEQIVAGKVRLPARVPEVLVPKVGRNELCPCRSGKKYKICLSR